MFNQHVTCSSWMLMSLTKHSKQQSVSLSVCLVSVGRERKAEVPPLGTICESNCVLCHSRSWWTEKMHIKTVTHRHSLIQPCYSMSDSSLLSVCSRCMQSCRTSCPHTAPQASQPQVLSTASTLVTSCLWSWGLHITWKSLKIIAIDCIYVVAAIIKNI